MGYNDLDILLKFLLDQKYYIHPMTVQGTFKEYYDEAEIMLTKLESDGYAESKVERSLRSTLTESFKYKISFEGRLFIQSGGYAQKLIRDDAENKRIERLETNQQKYERFVFWLTLTVAVGTVFQALLAVADLYWKYHWFH